MEAPLKDVSSVASSVPREEDRHSLLNVLQRIQEEALAPVGHALRFMADGYNDLAVKRRDASAQAVRDRILQQQLKSTLLGFDSFCCRLSASVYSGSGVSGGSGGFCSRVLSFISLGCVKFFILMGCIKFIISMGCTNNLFRVVLNSSLSWVVLNALF